MSRLIDVSTERPADREPVLASLRCVEEPPTRVWVIASWVATESRWADVTDDLDPEAGGDRVTHWTPLPAHPTV